MVLAAVAQAVLQRVAVPAGVLRNQLFLHLNVQYVVVIKLARLAVAPEHAVRYAADMVELIILAEGLKYV